MPPKYHLSYLPQGPGQKLSIREDDVKLVLERLPQETFSRFQVIHFSDPSRDLRWIGYINQEKAEIAISLLPPGVRRIRFVMRVGGGPTSRRFARRTNARKRRDLLFDVLVDDIGHLQIMDEQAADGVRVRSYEPARRAHTDYWRLRLWSFNFATERRNGASEPHDAVSEVIDVTEEKD